MPVSHYLPRPLPEALQGLAVLALDLRWSWHHGADRLWREVDAELWEKTANPWLILEFVSNQRLKELEQEPQFVAALNSQLAERESYFSTHAWFNTQFTAGLGGQIAYFCMEFGLSESLPLYSGGLGVLAGDYLKSASDLDVPLIGVGLFYQQGYFRQELDTGGEQLEFYPYNDPTMLPLVPLRDEEGEWVHISIALPGRELRLRSWKVQVGRRSLFLLDSNHPLNNPGDRGITSELYVDQPELRLQQEMVLGIGGWRLLERLGLECPVCHLNEGHAAFAILERARHFMQRTGVSFSVALLTTRGGNLFTTHTPVAAGFDAFPVELIRLYFNEYAQQLGISLEAFLALGQLNPRNNSEAFNMAWLATRGCGAVNGVSQLHADVSRGIFQPLFPRWPQQEVPVSYVTNGVHVPGWDSVAADKLWSDACGQTRWRGEMENISNDLQSVEDETLWACRCESRHQLVTFLRKRMVRQHCGRGLNNFEVKECSFLLDPDALTLGFARRFASYKRSDLLLYEPQRLLRLVTDSNRPVQLVIAGKAHPRDQQAKRLLRQWQDFLLQPEVRARIIFVEDYDLVVASQLVQGVDVWINTPRRPWEACGTSGMKVLVNGGLNLSTLDGWWAEAYQPELGWAIDREIQGENLQQIDRNDAKKLYQLLEQTVVPCFYQRDKSGIPRQWLQLMRKSMATLTAQYSTNRMLREYVLRYYQPLAENYAKRASSSGDNSGENLQQWYTNLLQQWPKLRISDMSYTTTDDGFEFDVQVYLADLKNDCVQLELYAEPLDGETIPFRETLHVVSTLASTVNAYLYRCNFATQRPASDFTPRIIPRHQEMNIPLEAPLIHWYR